jgi:hypothetical protein
METTINVAAHWTAGTTTQKQKSTVNGNIFARFLAFADGQQKSKTMWFMVSLIAQAVLFLPVPAVLMYYFNAPVVVLAITMGLFFANVIAGMGGAGTRVLISLFALSALIHLIMLAVFII